MTTSITSLNTVHEDIPTRTCSGKINPKYIPLKIIFFSFMAGQGANVVFRSLFIKHLGMSTTQNGIIWAVDRVFGIFVPPFLGWISDKSGKPKSTIVWVLVTGSILCASMFFIPPERHTYVASEERMSGCFVSSCSFNNISRKVRCLPLSAKYVCTNNTDEKMLGVMCNSANQTGRKGEEISRNKYLLELEKGSLLLTEEQNEESKQISCYTNDTQLVNKLRGINLTTLPQYHNNTSSSYSLCLCLPNGTVWTNEVLQVDKYGCTFWILLILMVLSSFSVFGGSTLIDSIILKSFSEKDKHKFSLQRLWGGLGFGLSTILVGFIKDTIELFVTDKQSNLIFLPYFTVPALFWSILCVVITWYSSSVTEERLDIKIRFSGIKTLLSNVRVFPFLLFAITIGYAIAVGEVYMFWLAEQRFNASSTILATSIAISTCFEIVAYLSSGRLIRLMGPRSVMSLGLAILGIRVYLYTLVSEAWHLLFAEVLRGLGWPTTWIATCHLTAKLSPPGLAATTMGLLQACTFGIGYGSGAILGGYLFETYGGDNMFKISFVLIVTVSVCYILISKFCDQLLRIRKKDTRNVSEEIVALKNGDLNQNVTSGDNHTYPTVKTETNGLKKCSSAVQ